MPNGGCSAQSMVHEGREPPASPSQAARKGMEKERVVRARLQRRNPKASDDGWRSACSYCWLWLSRSVVSYSVRPMDCSPPGSSVHGILQARIPQWVTISFSRGSSWPRDRTHVSCTGRWILYCWATWDQHWKWCFYIHSLSAFSPPSVKHCRLLFHRGYLFPRSQVTA